MKIVLETGDFANYCPVLSKLSRKAKGSQLFRGDDAQVRPMMNLQIC